MKKIFNLVFLYGGLLASMGFISCNSDGIDEVEVSVTEKVECSGDLRPYVQLSKGDYTLKKLKSYKSLGGDKLAHMQLTIAFDGIKAAEVSGLELILSIVDDNYNQVNSKAVFKITAWSNEAQNTIISGIKSGEGKFSISISTESGGVGDPVDADEWSEIKKKAKYVVISSSKASSIKSVGSLEKSNDIDELLDEFDAIHKGANTMEQQTLGASQKAHILDELDRLSNELDDLESDMSSNQKRRYEYIKNRTYEEDSDSEISEDNSYSGDGGNYSNEKGSSNWDEIISSYEKYVDKYIVFLKKAKNGDTSAMSEYPQLMQSAKEYSDKITRAQGQLTPSQWSRYLKIQQKMVSAAQNLN